MKTMLPILAAGALLAAGPAAASRAVPTDGLWLNPRGTVAVRTGDCQGRLCGWIVWADGQAMADARDSGIDRLIGVELLEDYVPRGAGHWSGSVYIPDIGHRFASTITQIGTDAMKVQGCLVGGFICKSQIWQRIARLPNG
ncbi:DUF2147 domain-containing protein [Sphingomonas sp. XMGL2]|uniref:DUF2147 domain-containing protein n=2 Tax=Sphingomonas quercus TaxID=2842451 RepID=A0ABS6BM11_9SPHN|nr:DUF2147 domain-containing protein [Sphingomonas quercus]MBU3079338.1 DUF2147 domain-containing protein [Sphingomonas quercus]